MINHKYNKKYLEITKVLVEEIKYNQNVFYIDLRSKVHYYEKTVNDLIKENK